jgi:hypothetical protein
LIHITHKCSVVVVAGAQNISFLPASIKFMYIQYLICCV